MEASAELKTNVNPIGYNGNTNGNKALSSDAIVAELLNDFAQAEKPLRIEDEIAGADLNPNIQDAEEVTKDRKHRKRKKEKKSKKKHHRERSRSRERKHSHRSRSGSKKSKKSRKERRSSSKTYSLLSDVPMETKLQKSPRIHGERKNSYIEPILSEDDDLPMGADYRTVLKEAKMSFNVTATTSLFNLENLPSDAACSVPKQLIEVFPLSKDVKIDDEFENKCEKTQSDLLKKVLVSKGKGDFVPRNVKLKSSNGLSSPKSVVKVNNETVPIICTAANTSEEPAPSIRVDEPISDTELEKKIEMELKEDSKNTPDDRWTKIIEESVKKIEEARSQNRIRSSHSDSDDSRKNERKKDDRSRSRERRRKKTDRSSSPKRSKKSSRRKRSRSADRHSRSRTPEKRRRNRSPRMRRSRSRSRRRTRSRSYNRRRHSSRERGNAIDKDKLREIAERKAKAARQLGMLDPTKSAETVEDFISYCEKLQKRQEKEFRRERGERVSSDDDSVCERRKPFQHPYGIKPAEPIKINIVNATQLPTKTPQECILDSTQLRVVFPVSSGVIHKESSEWKRVEPVVEKPPVSCLSTQKNHRAMSSLQVEQARIQGVPPPHAPSIPMLPVPPIPPTFPSYQNKLTAFDLLVPPPPPLPPTLFVPNENDMIMSEPVKIEKTAPRDVAKVLAVRARAQTALAEDPNDYDARRDLKDANDQMAAWAAAREEPGKFTGSTGLHVLSAEELQPRDPRFHAWVKKDMFKTARPAVSQVGMRLMMNMGWRPGSGLGREESGSVEPLTLDVKSDRKGLQTYEDLPARMTATQFKNAQATDVLGKNPVSLVMELCAKRKWANPTFTCFEQGTCSNKSFLWSAVINGVTYQPAMSSKNKKDGKALVCQVVLQALGVVPRDPSLPVRV